MLQIVYMDCHATCFTSSVHDLDSFSNLKERHYVHSVNEMCNYSSTEAKCS